MQVHKYKSDKRVMMTVSQGEQIAVEEDMEDETDGWIEVSTENGKGYVKSDEVSVTDAYPVAETAQEQQERIENATVKEIADDGTVLVSGDASSVEGDTNLINKIINVKALNHDCVNEGSEHLIDFPIVYDLCFWFDYNKECMFNKGNAFFFHCVGEKHHTAGCISVEKKDMIDILKYLTLLISVATISSNS